MFHERRCSSGGRALALHARGTGIDAPKSPTVGPKKKDIDMYVQYAKGRIWNSLELVRKRLVRRISKVYLKKTSKQLLYW